MSYQFVPTAGGGSDPVLYLTETALAGGTPGPTVVAHGGRRLVCEVVEIREPGQFLPANSAAIDGLGLAAGIPYRLRWTGGELRIGPVVGILAARKTGDLPGALSEGFLQRYPEVGGLVYLCAADAVEPGAEWIEGVAWQPDLPAAEIGSTEAWERAARLGARGVGAAAAEALPWPKHPRSARFAAMAGAFLEATPPGPERPVAGRFVAGRFPLPGALWRRTGYLTRPALDWLFSRVGPGIFNAHFFDKWQGYRLLEADPAVAPHLPETLAPERWLELLERDGAVILKQQDGNSGYGLMRVFADGAGWTLAFRERNGRESFAGLDDLAARIDPIVRSGRYLAQQWIDLPVYQQRRIDFRVMLQKDDRGCWEVRAILGRFGRPGSVVTNFVNAGYALPADEALRRAFGIGWREAFGLKADLIDLALAVGSALDRSAGCYGDLGLDIGIDRQRRLWLFEVNKLPFHELPLYAGQEQTYLEVKSGPLLYAAYLAGFGRR